MKSNVRALWGLAVILPFGLINQAAAALVYSQDFNNVTPGTTGTGIGDGTNIVSTNNSGAASVQDWGGFKALRLTQEAYGSTVSNFFLPDLNPGGFITSFDVSFDLLIQSTDSVYADGISFNIGQLNNTTTPYGSEYGMYNTSYTGDVLSVGWINYFGGTKRIVVQENGATVASNSSYPPITHIGTSVGPTVAVHLTWNVEDGLSLTYGGNSVFTNLAVSGFTPEAGYKFAFAARTGADTQDVWIDNLQINTVPEPSTALVGALALLGFLRRRR
ncbi:MAG: hypothetical protein RLZ22_289 [Verrucomicrobiota bacterium]|jgi:hypothetical protein